MAQYRRSEIVSGAFIILALVVFSLFAFQVGGLDLFWFLEGEAKVFQTLLPDIQTLEVGAKVAIGGRRVGRVTRIDFALPDDVQNFQTHFGKVWQTPYDEVERNYRASEGKDLFSSDKPPRVRIWFEVDEEEVEKEPGGFRLAGPPARAMLMQEGFLGPHYIQIFTGPASTDAPTHQIFGDDFADFGGDEDSAIPLIGMETGLFAALGESALPLMDDVRALVRKLNAEVLSDDNVKVLSSALVELDGVLKDARTLINERVSPLLDPANPEGLQQKLVQPANLLLVNANNTLQTLERDLKTMVLEKLSTLLDEGQATVEVAKGALEDARGAIARMTPPLERALKNLEEGTNDLDGRLNRMEAHVDNLVGELMTLLRQTNGMVAELRPETLETMESLRRAVWELELAFRKVRADPSLLIFGDDEKILHTWPSDPSGRRRTGRAAPYQQRDENEKK